MHTPEPRLSRMSGGGGDGVTPQARAGYLRRGDTSTLHGPLAAGPSVLFDEEAGTAVAVDMSPQPSQITSHLPSEPAASGQTRLPRQRPRFHTVQDLDVALNQAIEGKINSRNAWVSKEASDLLEGIIHTIETTLDAASADEYAGFAKAATVVEGCSKVWTSRVDSTYLQSNQMVQRLLRKDGTTSKTADGEGGDAGEDGEEVGDETHRNKSRSRGAAAAAAAIRTIALDATEINLDSKSRTVLTQTGVNAQFRAITSKFDQGNAQGLLMNNAPFGRAGNIILDVDYSLLPASVMPAGRVSGRRSGHRAAAIEPAASTSNSGDNNNTEVETTVASRTSQHAAVEHDAAMYESVDDFPPYTCITVMAGTNFAFPLAGSVNPPASARVSFALPQHGGVTHNGISNNNIIDAHAGQAGQLDPLLLLPHPSSSSFTPPNATLEDRHRLSSSNADANQFGETRPGGTAASVEGVQGGNDGGYDDDACWDGDGGVDDYDDSQYTTENERLNAGEPDNTTATTTTNITGAVPRDLGAEARNLVSGVTEVEAMDTLFHGHTQLALEAEDQTSWCPLSEVAKNPLAGGLGRSELSRLHREHRFTQPQRPQMGSTGDGNGAESFLNPASPTAKRARKERTVVFQLPDSGSFNGSAGSVFIPLTKAELLEDDALRQATTAARNITPLGKQLLLGKDAAHNVVAYTQSSLQRIKAEQAGLVLSDAPVPGKTIPSYMPYPIHTQDYFQPFSTSLTQWNLLRKSATGRLIDNSSNNGTNKGTDIPGSAHSSSSNANNTANGITAHRLGYYGAENGGTAVDDDDDAGYGTRCATDMPVEFFPGGAEVEDEDGAEAGGDYADYADLYGPNDDYHNEEEERRYVQDGFRNSSDGRLLAQVEAVAARNSTGSSAFSGRSSGDGHNVEGLLTDPMALLQVLTPPEATIPNQVDVVRLRQIMWDALQGHLIANQQEKAVDLAALRHEDAAGDVKGRQYQVGPVTAKTAVKAHAQAVLDRIRKRARTADVDNKENNGSSAEESEEEEDEEKPPQLSRRNPNGKLTLPSDAAASKASAADIAVTRFSDVVRSVLPHIASVSSTNTLSPAFFFFSILFLANQHNVVLQSVDTLDDLRVCGIARRVGA